MKKELNVKFCTKCSKILGDEDKFCRYCGNEAVTMPFEEVKKIERAFISECIYGPPYGAKYICSNCGKVFIEHGLGSPDMEYCTECGTKFYSLDEKDMIRKPLRYCSECNEMVGPDDEVCKYCGGKPVDSHLPLWIISR